MFFFFFHGWSVFAHEVGEQNEIWNVSAKNTLTMATFLAKTFQIPFCSSLLLLMRLFVCVCVCVCVCVSLRHTEPLHLTELRTSSCLSCHHRKEISTFIFKGRQRKWRRMLCGVTMTTFLFTAVWTFLSTEQESGGNKLPRTNNMKYQFLHTGALNVMLM